MLDIAGMSTCDKKLNLMKASEGGVRIVLSLNSNEMALHTDVRAMSLIFNSIF